MIAEQEHFLGHVCFAQFASADRIDTLITDALDSKMRAAFQEFDMVCLEAASMRNPRD